MSATTTKIDFLEKTIAKSIFFTLHSYYFTLCKNLYKSGIRMWIRVERCIGNRNPFLFASSISVDSTFMILRLKNRLIDNYLIKIDKTFPRLFFYVSLNVCKISFDSVQWFFHNSRFRGKLTRETRPRLSDWSYDE